MRGRIHWVSYQLICKVHIHLQTYIFILAYAKRQQQQWWQKDCLNKILKTVFLPFMAIQEWYYLSFFQIWNDLHAANLTIQKYAKVQLQQKGLVDPTPHKRNWKVISCHSWIPFIQFIQLWYSIDNLPESFRFINPVPTSSLLPNYSKNLPIISENVTKKMVHRWLTMKLILLWKSTVCLNQSQIRRKT